MKHPIPLFGFLLATVSLSSPSTAQELPSEPYFPGLKLAKAARGSAILGALGKSLPEVARQYRMTEQELGKLCLTDRDLAVDTSGKLLYGLRRLGRGSAHRAEGRHGSPAQLPEGTDLRAPQQAGDIPRSLP